MLWNREVEYPQARSAGVWARSGLAMDPHSQTQVLERGVDPVVVETFRSRPVDRAGLSDADLILCMEDAHVTAVLELNPATANKTFTLLELLEITRLHPEASWRELSRLRHGVRGGDVADPAGMAPLDYARTADFLAETLQAIIGWAGWMDWMGTDGDHGGSSTDTSGRG